VIIIMEIGKWTLKKRLTLDPPLQRRLKAVTARKGISMRQYCQAAIEKELTKDDAQGLTTLPFGQEALNGSIQDWYSEVHPASGQIRASAIRAYYCHVVRFRI
jgi:hypothetical protein